MTACRPVRRVGWLRSQRRRERGVAAAERDQFVVRAEFDELAVVDDRDPIGTAHRRQPVGDDDRRATRHQPIERPLDDRLGARIEVARRLVEHQHRRVDQRGTGERDELTLPGRQA